uniref:Uncharacterized protein n=1 Tax=Brassica oleracea var. oleracea TaxID=109376 RepID=A0A0D3BGK5_BRAOL
MEDSFELEELIEDIDHNSEKKLDDDHYTSRGDMETSKASIGRHQPDEIDRQPPHIIDLHPPNIDRHRQPLIDRHHPPNIDRCPLLDVPPCCIIEMEPIEEMMYMSKASPLAVPKHQRPPIWTVEAAGFHKRGPAEPISIDTDRIPSIDTNKPASIDTTTSPLINTTASPSIDTTTSSSIDTGRVSEHKEFNVCGNLRDGDTTTRSDKSGGKKRRNWKKRKRIKDGPQVSLTPHFSDCVRKSRVHSTSTDETSSISIDSTSDPTIDCLFIVSNDCYSHRPMRPRRYQSTAFHQQRSIVTSLCRSKLSRSSFLVVKLCTYD